MEYIKYGFEIILLTLVFSIPGLFIELWMEAQGLVPSDKFSVVLGVLGAVLIKTIWFDNITWWIWSITLIIVPPLAGHRYDLWMTIKKGRWWWKQENNTKES